MNATEVLHYRFHEPGACNEQETVSYSYNAPSMLSTQPCSYPTYCYWGQEVMGPGPGSSLREISWSQAISSARLAPDPIGGGVLDVRLMMPGSLGALQNRRRCHH